MTSPAPALPTWKHRILHTFCLGLLSLSSLAICLAAPAAEMPEKKVEQPAAPLEEQIQTTRHRMTVGGEAIAYTATAGNYVMKAEDGTPKASMFFVSYTRDGQDDPTQRPVMFSFNGGPGAAAVWVHLGAFGPKKVKMTEDGFALPPPGQLVDNEYTLLPQTDMVFIDPISTGYSRPAPGEDREQFHGVRQDVEWVGEFIRLWLTRNGRWASPKLIAGESYGTARAAGLAAYLQDHSGIYMNGLVLISTVLNWQNQEFAPGNDLPHMIHLPGYAATAWYHQQLEPDLQARPLEELLAEVEEFALTDFALALHQGAWLEPERRREIAERIARYTGLSADFVEANDLRIELGRFRKELLREEGKTVGRLDSRFTGYDRDSGGDSPEFDPSSEAVNVGYVALLNDYLRRELKYESDLRYRSLASEVWPWSYSDFQNEYANLGEYLRQAMTRNPSLKVLLTSGYYDFATPYFDSEYTVAHLGLPEELRDNVEITYYEAGHMMYIRKVDHEKFRDDLAAFIAEAVE